MIDFWRFVALRQAAYWRRERGQGPPYSDDPAIARYHFCNVYREADRGTRWFQSHRTPSPDDSPVGLISHEIWQSVVYRLVNRISTFEAYGRIPQFEEGDAWLQFLIDRMGAGEKIFTGRHLNRGYAYYAATVSYLEDSGLFDVSCAVLDAGSLEAVCRQLTTIPNVGRFFAWQVTCDLVESDALPRYSDSDTWAMLGPGAVNGARLVDLSHLDGKTQFSESLRAEMVWPLAATHAHSARECLWVARMLQEDQARCLEEVGMELVPPPEAPGPMSLKNVEHALCEYARYVRASNPANAAGLEVKPWAK